MLSPRQFFIQTLTTMLLSLPILSSASVNTSNEIIEFDAEKLPKLDSLKHEKPLQLHIPKMQRFTTTNGIPVIFTAVHELPLVDISILFNVGSNKDNELKSEGFGIAHMTASLISKGTKTLNEEQFGWQAERLGVVLGANTNRDNFTYIFRSLANDDELMPALDLFADMIQNPLFDKDTLKRTQDKAIIRLKRSQQSADYLANRAFLNAVYGAHPYAKDSVGTIDSITKITQTDLKQYHQKYLVAENAYISITGDLTEKKAKQLAEKLSLLLPHGKKASPTPAPVKPQPAHIHIDYDSPQTAIIIGHLGTKNAKTPKEIQDALNFRLGNKILAGGDFNARLMNVIRKQGGYTYGITGLMVPYTQNGIYYIRFSTTTDKAKEAITKTLAVIDDTLKTGISQSELQLASTNFRHSYPMTLSNNLAIHNMATNLNLNNLPDSYLSDFLVRLDNATVENVNQALQDHLRPKEFIIVTVGKEKPDLADIFQADNLAQ